MKTLVKWHRSLAWALAGLALLWMFSGLMHPLLSRMGPTLILHTDWRDSPDPILQARLSLPSEIAQHEASASSLTQFNDEYQRFQKVLPVWRVAFNDPLHTRVMIDPASGRILSGTDDQKLGWTRWFKYLHTWNIPGLSRSWTQPGKAMASLGVSAIVLLGIAMLVKRSQMALPPGTNTRRIWHRRLGALVCTPLLLFTLSGTLHLYRNALPAHMASLEKWTFNVLHKWQFLDFAGRDVRDAAQAATVMGMIGLICLGLRRDPKKR